LGTIEVIKLGQINCPEGQKDFQRFMKALQ